MDGFVKKMIICLVLITGILADDPDDHQLILKLRSSMKKLEFRVGDVEDGLDEASKNVTKLATTVESEGDTQEQLAKKLNKVDAKSTEIASKVDDVEGQLTEKIESLERRLKDQMTNMTQNIEAKFVSKEKLVELGQRVSKHEGKINELQDKGSDLSRKVDNIIAFLPNGTHLNVSDDVSKRVGELEGKLRMFQESAQAQLNQLMEKVIDIKEKDIEQVKNQTVRAVEELKEKLGTYDKELSSAKAEIDGVKKTAASIGGNVNNLKKEIDTFDKQLLNAKEDLKKYIPDVNGFKYTGPGWAYSKDMVTKRGITLTACLQFCEVKRSMDRSYDGVNFIDHANRPVCYCLKKMYGFNPMKNAFRFVATRF